MIEGGTGAIGSAQRPQLGAYDLDGCGLDAARRLSPYS
jgi:hypothetical protein